MPNMAPVAVRFRSGHLLTIGPGFVRVSPAGEVDRLSAELFGAAAVPRYDTRGWPEPSELVQASPSLMENWRRGGLHWTELERRARGAERLKELCSSIPWHTQAAARIPDYWHSLYASRVNS